MNDVNVDNSVFQLQAALMSKTIFNAQNYMHFMIIKY